MTNEKNFEELFPPMSESADYLHKHREKLASVVCKALDALESDTEKAILCAAVGLGVQGSVIVRASEYMDVIDMTPKQAAEFFAEIHKANDPNRN